MFDRILLPTDGSPHALEAARVAAELARRHGSSVRLLSVVEPPEGAGASLPAEVREELIARVAQRASSSLAQAEQVLREAGVDPPDARVAAGAPDRVIIEEATSGCFDLIIMGSRGISLDAGRGRLIGSVTEWVLHRSPCPVLVVKA